MPKFSFNSKKIKLEPEVDDLISLDYDPEIYNGSKVFDDPGAVLITRNPEFLNHLPPCTPKASITPVKNINESEYIVSSQSLTTDNFDITDLFLKPSMTKL